MREENLPFRPFRTLVCILSAFLLSAVVCYPPLKCPTREQWTFRAQNCSNTDGYVCLLDINTRHYREACISNKQKEITPGYKRVFAGNLHGVPCKDDSFQPFTFWTNGNSDCIYKKSTCNEEGQVLYNHGSHTTDSLCRCNYNLGYNFVITPKNRCYCVPTEEDCSCYQKTCSSGQLLTQDYECADMNNWPIKFSCPAVPFISSTLQPHVETTNKIPDENIETKDFTIRTIPVKSIVAVIIFLIVIVIVCLAFEENTRGRIQYVYEAPNPVEMPQNIKDLQDQETKKWKKEMGKFVLTRACSCAKPVLEENQNLVITGPAGCGKTVTAHFLVLEMVEKLGYQLLIVHSPDDLFRYAKMDRKQVIFIDDIFGKHAVSDFERAWWQKQHERIEALFCKNVNLKVIATCRSDVFLEMDHHVTFSFRELSFVSTNTRLSIDERRDIGKMYHEDVLDNLDDELINRYDFFPAICASKQSLDVLDEIKCPVNFLTFEIKNLYECKSIKLFSMSWLVVRNNQLDEDKLELEYDKDWNMFKFLSRDLGMNVPSKTDIKTSFHALTGSYLNRVESTYSFKCKQLFSMAMYITSKYILRTILKFGKFAMLKDKVILDSLCDNPSVSKLTLIVPEQYQEAYFDRLYIYLRSDVSLNIFLDVQNKFEPFRSLFITYLQKRKLESKNLVRILHDVAEAGYLDYMEYFLKIDMSAINQNDDMYRTPLHIAAREGHSNLVTFLKENGAFTNATDKDMKTPLDIACSKGHRDTVKALVSNSGMVSSNSTTLVSALNTACTNGNLEIVRILVNAKADVNGDDSKLRLPLISAAKKGHTGVIDFLLSSGADVNQVDPKTNSSAIFYSSKRNNKEGVKLLLTHNADPNTTTTDEASCLHISCENRHTEIVRLLVTSKATNIDKQDRYGRTALFIACEKGYSDITRIIINNHADINKKDNALLTPLFIASQNGSLDIVKMLLTAKADMHDMSETNNELWSPLHISCTANKLEVVKELIRFGADVEQRNKGGNTPLHKAVFYDNVEIVRTLLEHKAKIESRNNFGETPLFVAVTKSSMKSIKLLVQSGANINSVNNVNVSIISKVKDREILSILESQYQNEATIQKDSEQ